ncbi:unnamed protein product, partial [Meganyctiphanes norvegica]
MKLFDAAKVGDGPGVQAAIQNQADINWKNPDGVTPLLIASLMGHSTIVEMLLNANVDVNMKANDGRTPLWAATIMGRSAVVKMLLKEGAENVRRPSCASA